MSADVRRQIGAVVARPFVRAAVLLHLSPDVLTLAGLAVSLVSAVLVGLGNFVAGGIVMVLAALCDMFDGAVARTTGRETRFGALLDSVTDRISEAALLSALVVVYTSRGQTAGAVICIVALIGSFLTSYVRARAEGLGLDCKVGVFTRVERVVVLGVGLVLNGVLWDYGALAAVSVVAFFSWITVVQRVAYVRRLLSK
ncbi:MAG: CDP-alcohol phosphatidyltransferase family protein [Chloroflexi bacterium]|nr:CDP-alcohol phosphatidyltransferase family protein [Chloroflexota bacterium]